MHVMPVTVEGVLDMMTFIPALNVEINIYVVPFMVGIIFLLFASVASIMVWGHTTSSR